MLNAQAETVEPALGTAAQAVEDRRMLPERMAAGFIAQGHQRSDEVLCRRGSTRLHMSDDGVLA